MRAVSIRKVVLVNLALVVACAATLYPVLWVVKMALAPAQGFSLSASPIPVANITR